MTQRNPCNASAYRTALPWAVWGIGLEGHCRFTLNMHDVNHPQAYCAGDSPELYCQRCPSLESASDYTLLLVAVSDAHRHCNSALQLLPVSTKDVTPPVFLSSAYASAIGESNFTLTVQLSEPGKDHHSRSALWIAPSCLYGQVANSLLHVSDSIFTQRSAWR